VRQIQLLASYIAFCTELLEFVLHRNQEGGNCLSDEILFFFSVYDFGLRKRS